MTLPQLEMPAAGQSRTSVLALDLGRRLGWAHYNSFHGPMTSGVFILPSTDEEIGPYLNAFYEWFIQKAVEVQPEIVVYEAPIIVGGKKDDKKKFQQTPQGLLKLYGLTAFVEWLCVQMGIPVRQVMMQQYRKHFCGVGNGPREKMKNLMMQAARLRGFNVVDDNEAEAIGLLDFSLTKLHIRGLPSGPLFAGTKQ